MKKFLKNPFVILFIILIFYIILIRPVGKIAINEFFLTVSEEFDDYITERFIKIENGEIVENKDILLMWKYTYDIRGNHGKYFLLFKREPYEYGGCVDDLLLKNVTGYKVKKDTVYITSKEGYAVIDKDNKCRLFITIPEEDFVDGYDLDENGNKIYRTRRIENEYLTYLNSFNEFSEEEQKTFLKLEKKADKKDKKKIQKLIKNGEIIPNEHSWLIWENKYEIVREPRREYLSVHIEGKAYILLDEIENYLHKENKLYISSKEGYAVIDTDNKVRIYLSVPEAELNSRFTENGDITYLKSFDEFSREEQKYLINE